MTPASNISATAHAPADQRAPEWVHLVPSGTFYGADGRGPYTLAHPYAVVRASMANGKLPIDENHATDLHAPAGRPAPARGWIVAMDVRPNGVWGLVEWTETGRRLVLGRAYRAVSPALERRKDGTIVRVLRCALTNAPNLPQITTLHSQVVPMPSDSLRSLPAAEAARPLTKDDIAIATRFGIDPEKLAQKKQAAIADLGRSLGLAADEMAFALKHDLDPRDLARRKTAAVRNTDPGKSGLNDFTPKDIEIAKRMGLDLEKLSAARKAKQEALEEYDLRKKIGLASLKDMMKGK